MLVFAQWHFWIFTCILLLILAAEVAFAVSRHNDERRSRYTSRWRKQKERNKILFRRFTMLVIGVFCAVPCFIAAIVYDFRSPTYEATPSTLEIYFQEAEPAEEGEDVYDFLKSVRIPAKICLDWRKNSSPLGALPIIKQGLGIPSAHLTTEKLGGYTVGEYSAETNEMWIDMRLIHELCKYPHWCHDSTYLHSSSISFRSFRSSSKIFANPYTIPYSVDTK